MYKKAVLSQGEPRDAAANFDTYGRSYSVRQKRQPCRRRIF